MKAAVMYQGNNAPQYVENFPEPIINNKDELLITMKAAAIKNLDKGRAAGTHYSTENKLNDGKVVGGDGVGLLKDGTKIYAVGASGTIAEKATVEKDRIVKLPDGIDDAIAAALPNAVMGSAMALRFRAKMQKGETVLINGATSVTGKIAVQIAKYYGAKKIIVTGRNEDALQLLKELGADKFISLKQEDDAIINQIKSIHNNTPIDIIIDYLWGHSAELILASLKGNGTFTHNTRYVSVGAMSGNTIQLSSSILRSVNLQLSGSGLGSWTKDEVKILFKEILPEMFQLAVEGKLKLEIITVDLKDVESAWQTDVAGGKRMVITI